MTLIGSSSMTIPETNRSIRCPPPIGITITTGLFNNYEGPCPVGGGSCPEDLVLRGVRNNESTGVRLWTIIQYREIWADAIELRDEIPKKYLHQESVAVEYIDD